VIIDIHGHIGDILYPGGGALIFREGVEFPASKGILKIYEKNLSRETLVTRLASRAFPMRVVNAERKRNFAATLRNFRLSLEGTEIDSCVCAPVSPNNTYEDMLAARNADARVIAFTSPDFSGGSAAEKLSDDLSDPVASGVKIHPILQKVKADSKEVFEAVEVVSSFSKPVLLHTGKARYYPFRENKEQFTGFASIDKVKRLAEAFPQVSFIIGHAGLEEVWPVIDLLSGCKNTYAETSFQPPAIIRELLSAFGKDRVVFGSDWPYGLRLPAILAVEEACGSDLPLREAVLHSNAAKLLEI